MTASALAALLLLAGPRYRFPLEDPDQILKMVIGVDHEPVDHGPPDVDCVAYDGAEDFPHCYDQHKGSDFLLDGGFGVMDAGSLVILAAADGNVVEVADGNYDRCHGDFGSGKVDCDGHPMKSNHVRVEHDGGRFTEYHHMKNGSLLVKVGDHVTCGQPLGLVGSSGRSSMPHLHFQVEDAHGAILDPYVVGEGSLWMQQDGGDGLPGALCEPAPAEPVEATVVVEADAGAVVSSEGASGCQAGPRPGTAPGLLWALAALALAWASKLTRS